MYDEIDGPLSKLLDQGGALVPLLTQPEVRAVRYSLWLFGQGDGPGSEAAREMADRLDRRLRYEFPAEEATVPGVTGVQYGDL